MMRNAQRMAALAAFSLLTGPSLQAMASPEDGAVTPKAPIERIKTLAGEWVAAEDGEMAKKGDLVARYAVTAAGSAVVETVFPGSRHEMVTVYHADGRDLVLTHYCMEGNQPRMRAKDAKGSRFEFAYDGGTNIDRKRDRHMNSASMEIMSADEIKSVWTEIQGEKTVFVARTHLVRKR